MILRERLCGTAARLPPVAVGDLVPDLVFEDDRGQYVSLRALRGRPAILAVSSRWNAGEGTSVGEDELGAELRALGAALLVVSGQGLWLLEADDPRRDLALRGVAGGNGVVYRALGIRRDEGGEHALTLFVVDATGTLRSIHSEPAGPREALGVLTALRTAREALWPRPVAPSFLLNRRELVIATLISAFALLALDGCTPTAPAPRQRERAHPHPLV